MDRTFADLIRCTREDVLRLVALHVSSAWASYYSVLLPRRIPRHSRPCSSGFSFLCFKIIQGTGLRNLTQRRRDAKMRGLGDAKTRGREDAGTRRREDAETRRRGDAKTRGRQDNVGAALLLCVFAPLREIFFSSFPDRLERFSKPCNFFGLTYSHIGIYLSHGSGGNDLRCFQRHRRAPAAGDCGSACLRAGARRDGTGAQARSSAAGCFQTPGRVAEGGRGCRSQGGATPVVSAQPEGAQTRARLDSKFRAFLDRPLGEYQGSC